MKQLFKNLYFLIPISIVYLIIFVAGSYAEKIVKFEAIRPPTFLVSQPEITNGDIVTTILKQKKILVDHLTLSEEVSPIVELAVSPDKEKVCFQTQLGKENLLYQANWDGTDVVKIGPGSRCAWSPNSSKVVYLSPIQNTGFNHVSCYYLEDGLNLNITSRTVKNPREYKNPIWSLNNRDVFVQYQGSYGWPTSGIIVVDTIMRTVSEK
ncbi:hypothetical protein MUP65_01305 [Patescibacteria group bacterium]|nr:hypothetical protein [Patescibacteria group bacterium]